MPSEASAAKPKEKISMRHSKLTAAEAALLSGELNKPSWESKNEGIHERVSFEDSIWGFDLAGGSFYNTPLRVTYVKPDSRADKAGIRAGDRLKRINDIDTSTLTIQEAHEIIIESGVHLRLAVTAPEDIEDAYFCYEDPLDNDGYDSEEERRKEAERERKRHVHAKVSSYWSLQWPWVSKRRVIYRESNCFMVPSKYEDGHKDKFLQPPNHGHIVQEDISLDSTLQNAANGDADPKIEDKNVNPNTNETDTKPPVDEKNADNSSSAIPNDVKPHQNPQESVNETIPMETNDLKNENVGKNETDLVENDVDNSKDEDSENISKEEGKINNETNANKNNEDENTQNISKDEGEIIDEIHENVNNEDISKDDEDISENLDSVESKLESELSENIDTIESKDETEDTENVDNVDSKNENEASENLETLESNIDTEISEEFDRNEDSNVNEDVEPISDSAAETLDEPVNDEVLNEALEDNTETAKGEDETNCEKILGEEDPDSERQQ